ncbi:hypothetical protein ABW19_dt0206167 [Dactylella cylindrospora]|nr:hypothetical protein ABW19_dt0206167 [Dactylella cylindrospora]
MGLLKYFFRASFVLLAPLAASQVTITTTITELVICSTTQYTTTTLSSCPCSPAFSTTNTSQCQTGCCSATTLVSSSASPSASSDQFTIDLTVPLSGGDQTVTLSRVGNTIGIGGDTLIFNLSSSGELRDVSTGDIAFVILPSGAIRKRFEGSVDLLIGTNPPSVASTTAWRRTSDGDLSFIAGESSANPVTLGFGVYLTDDGQIDTTVPIQMYDVSAGLPSDIENGIATQSIVSTSQIASSSQIDSSTSKSAQTSSSSSRSSSLPTYIITQYGSTTTRFTSTADGTIFIIIVLQWSTTTTTLYAAAPTTSFYPFDGSDPTITEVDFLSQYVTTSTIYGSTVFLSTPTVGNIFPTLTAIAQFVQSTYSNITYGPTNATLSAQVDSTLPTVTVYILSAATATITSTSYIPNQFPIVTTTLYGLDPTATVLILSPQYVVYTTTYASTAFTSTVGPSNPTATYIYGVSTPTTTVTLLPPFYNWNVTTITISTPSQTQGLTLSVRQLYPYPPSSPVQFAPTDASVSSQYLVASPTMLSSSYSAWVIGTAPTSLCKFIQVENDLILATDPTTGTRLPNPAYSFTIFPFFGVESSPIYYAMTPDFLANPIALDGGVYWRTIDGQYVYFNATTIQRLQNLNAGFYYVRGPGPYRPVFKNVLSASLSSTYVSASSTVMRLVSSAPTAKRALPTWTIRDSL